MYKAESFDFGVIFNISPSCAVTFFVICTNGKNNITSEFLKIIHKICSKGERKINGQYRLFSMCYLFNRIYDFNKIILILNDYLNDLYDKAKNDLISEKKKNNVIKDLTLFINYAFNQVNNYLKHDININEGQIIKEICNKFKKEDFINRFKNEFINKNNDEIKLEFIDGNECVKIINNINEKIYSIEGNLLDFLDSEMIRNFFFSKKPLTDTIKIALFNYENQDTKDNKKIFFYISDGESEELEEKDLEYFQKISLEKKIYIFAIYIYPKKLNMSVNFMINIKLRGKKF